MNTIMNWINRIRTSIRAWWSNNHEQIEQNVEQSVEQGVRRLDSAFDRLIRNIARLMIIGVILNVVASYFYPEFPERFPVIYGWFDGWLQFGEFAFKATLGGMYKLLTGHWSDFWTEYNEAIQELLSQFANWISNIHF